MSFQHFQRVESPPGDRPPPARELAWFYGGIVVIIVIAYKAGVLP